MSEESKAGTARKKSIIYTLGFVGMLLFFGGATISSFIIKAQPQVLGLSAQSEVTILTSQIGKLIVLPSDELPTATTINDASKLKDQFFFRNAKNNDKLLTYTNAKWAVLYRPTENKIIEAGPFNANQSATVTPTLTPSPTPSPTPTPTPSPSLTPSPTSTPSATPSPTQAQH